MTLLTAKQLIVLDEMTPTFKIIMEQHLSPQLRRVMAVLARMNRMAKTREIASEARLAVNTTSTVLGRLVKLGYVTSTNVNNRVKRYDIAVIHKWLALWLRAKGNPEAFIGKGKTGTTPKSLICSEKRMTARKNDRAKRCRSRVGRRDNPEKERTT